MLKKILPFIYFTFFSFAIIKAQSVFKPTPQQQKVLDKAISKIISVLNQFNSNDWEIVQDYYNGNPFVSKDPDVPLDIDQNFERQYKVREGSETFNRQIKPLYDRIAELMKQEPIPYDSVTALGDKLKELSNVTVYVYINRANLEVHPDPKTDRKTTGAAFVHKASGEYLESDKGFSYYLGFGNWSAAKWDAENHWLRFHFIHPPLTPYIENIVVIIFGAGDRIQDLLNKIDWKLLNDALTI